MKPFPLRTLLLMVLALVAFVRFYCVTHPRPPKQVPVRVMTVEGVPSKSEAR